MNSYDIGYDTGYNKGYFHANAHQQENIIIDNVYDLDFNEGYIDGYRTGYGICRHEHNKLTVSKKNYVKRKNMIELNEKVKNPRTENIELAPSIQYTYKHVGECNNLDDLIRIGEKAKTSPIKYRYNIDMNKLINALDAIKKFNNMIGLKDIKQIIFTKIMYHLHGLHDPIVSKETNHCCITGVPGVGKTELIKHLAEIYSKIGAVTTGQIVYVKIYDLIANHIGGTAIKTKKILEKATGGVLVIDEAYSVGNSEGKNTFNEEAITLIMAWLTEAAATSICCISGYEDQIKSRLFSINPGLESRFSTTLHIVGYSAEELKDIFIKLIYDANWTFDINEINTEFFQTNLIHFPAFGRDMENLFKNSKEAHSKRLTNILDEETLLTTKKKLSIDDLKNGLTQKTKNTQKKGAYLSMYI